MDVFGGEIRRRDVFPLLVLHLIAREPAYGNRLIEEIEGITNGVISVNPNTIYPLLRDMEARGLIEGQWEHPDRRTQSRPRGARSTGDWSTSSSRSSTR